MEQVSAGARLEIRSLKLSPGAFGLTVLSSLFCIMLSVILFGCSF